MSEGEGPNLSVIIPCLDDGDVLEKLLLALQPLRGSGVQILVVDGGSLDASVTVSEGLCDQLLSAPAGRARQMNLGANQAIGRWLWFLHADSELSLRVLDSIREITADSQPAWGRFDIRLLGSHRLLPLTSTLINLRSRFTGMATGDQGIFVHRKLFEQVGGFAEIPLMEDLQLSRDLKQFSRPRCLRAIIGSSGRRWDREGYWRTIFLMWWLRLQFFLGRSPAALAARYRPCSSPIRPS